MPLNHCTKCLPHTLPCSIQVHPPSFHSLPSFSFRFVHLLIFVSFHLHAGTCQGAAGSEEAAEPQTHRVHRGRHGPRLNRMGPPRREELELWHHWHITLPAAPCTTPRHARHEHAPAQGAAESAAAARPTPALPQRFTVNNRRRRACRRHDATRSSPTIHLTITIPLFPAATTVTSTCLLPRTCTRTQPRARDPASPSTRT